MMNSSCFTRTGRPCINDSCFTSLTTATTRITNYEYRPSILSALSCFHSTGCQLSEASNLKPICLLTKKYIEISRPFSAPCSSSMQADIALDPPTSAVPCAIILYSMGLRVVSLYATGSTFRNSRSAYFLSVLCSPSCLLYIVNSLLTRLSISFVGFYRAFPKHC